MLVFHDLGRWGAAKILVNQGLLLVKDFLLDVQIAFEHLLTI